MAGHSPEERVQRTGLLAEEVPGRVMSSRSLGDLVVGAGLDSMDQIREENGILDEEDWNVVADDICSAVRRCQSRGLSDDVPKLPSSV